MADDIKMPVIQNTRRMVPDAAYLGSIVIRTAESDKRTRQQIEQLKEKYPKAFQ